MSNVTPVPKAEREIILYACEVSALTRSLPHLLVFFHLLKLIYTQMLLWICPSVEMNEEAHSYKSFLPAVNDSGALALLQY